jgi:hypothetical protein
MDLFKVSFTISEAITRNLASGIYTRIGGVITEASTGRLIAFLREFRGMEQLTAQVVQLLGGAAGLGVLNLGLTTMSFALVSKRLSGIERRLMDVQELLQQINRKIDLSFYATFRAALDLAGRSYTVSSAASRNTLAVEAASKFAETKHRYCWLADEEMAAGTEAAGEYLSTLALACVAEAACYLQLEETATARRILEEGFEEYDRRARRYVSLLLTSNPSAYLHPSLKEEISLDRVTRVLHWLSPKLDARAVLEEQRENLFRLSEQTDQWAKTLPRAIWDPALHGQLHGGGALGRIFGKTDVAEVYKRLPGTLRLMESLVEDCCRLQMYRVEVETIQRSRMSFAEWRQLSPPESAAGARSPLILIIPPEMRVRVKTAPRVRAVAKPRVKAT